MWARSSIQFASLAVAALAIGWFISSRRAPRVTAAVAVCCAIPFWGAMQLMLGTSVSDFATRNAILDSAVFAALFFIAVQIFEDTTLRRRLLEILFLFAFVVSAAAVVSPILRHIDANDFCVFVELMLPIGLYLLCEPRDRRMRYVSAVLSATLISSAMVTGSRAGCALIAVEIVIVPLVLRARHALAPIASMLALVAIFIAGLGWQQLASRYQTGDPLDGRTELVTSAMNMVRDRPWTGFGLGGFETAYPQYALIDNGLRVTHANNDWAEWTATGGLPLLAMYLALFGLTLPLMLRNVWAIGPAAMCLHALARSPFEVPALLILNAILLGAASATAD